MCNDDDRVVCLTVFLPDPEDDVQPAKHGDT